MFENLLKLVTEHAQDAIVNNSAVPNEHNEAAIQEVTNAIHNGMAQQASGGGLSDLLHMFSGQASADGHPMVQNIISTAAASLSSKFGVDPSQATSIVSALVPNVMSHLTSQTADPGNSNFDMNGIISSLTGGQGGSGIDFNNVLSQLKSGGGGMDIGSIVSQFTGGGQTGGGGIAGMISGFLK